MNFRFGMIGLALAALLSTGVGPVSFGQTDAWANASQCRARCNRQFAQCYSNSGGDRRTCQAQRARCLNNCLQSSNDVAPDLVRRFARAFDGTTVA